MNAEYFDLVLLGGYSTLLAMLLIVRLSQGNFKDNTAQMVALEFDRQMIWSIVTGNKTQERRRLKDKRVQELTTGDVFELVLPGGCALIQPQYARLLSVRIEPVGVISNADAFAEGAPSELCRGSSPTSKFPTAKDWFVEHFNALYGCGAFQANPLVQVLEFELMQSHDVFVD